MNRNPKNKFTYTTRNTPRSNLEARMQESKNSALNESSRDWVLCTFHRTRLWKEDMAEEHTVENGDVAGPARRGHEAPAHQCADHSRLGRRFRPESPVCAAGLRIIIGLRLRGGEPRAGETTSLRPSRIRTLAKVAPDLSCARLRLCRAVPAGFPLPCALRFLSPSRGDDLGFSIVSLASCLQPGREGFAPFVSCACGCFYRVFLLWTFVFSV